MKILGLNSKLNIAGQVFSVSKISRKGITVTNGKMIMELSLKETSENICNQTWVVEK